MNASDLRFLRWLSTFCAPGGTTIGKVSAVVGRNERRGFIVRQGLHVALTDAGHSAVETATNTRRIQ